MSYKELFKAVKAGDVEAVTEAIQGGANPNESAGEGKKAKTPVIVAAVLNGDADILDVLINAGADITATGKRGKTLLRMAYEGDSIDMFTSLLKADAAIDDGTSEAPLLSLMIQDDADKEFLDAILARPKGFDVNKGDKEGYAALHHAVQQGRNKLALRLLKPPFSAKTDVQTKGRGLYPCHIAAGTGADDLLEHFDAAALGHVNNKGSTALMSAVCAFAKGAVDVLIEKGADVNVANQEGMTAIHYACEGGDVEVVAKLVEAGAKINAVTAKGHSALDMVVGLAPVRPDFDSEALTEVLKKLGAEEVKQLDLDDFLGSDDEGGDVEDEDAVADGSADAATARKIIGKKGEAEEEPGISRSGYAIVAMLVVSCLIPLLMPIMMMFEEQPNMFKELDTNSDGRISKKEVKVWYKEKNPDAKKLPPGFFESRDLDGNGFIDWAEFDGAKGSEP